MSFLNPTALYFIPLVSLPILIHLLGRKTRYKQKFSWIELLEKARTEGMHRKRPYEILLIILRTLFILFLILAFSNPVRLRNLDAIKTIWIDVSHSMSFYERQRAQFESRMRELLPDVPIKYFADGPVEGKAPQKTYFSTSLKGISGNSMIFSDFQKTMFKGARIEGKTILVRPKNGSGNMAITDFSVGVRYAVTGMRVPVRVKLQSFLKEPWSGKVEVFAGGQKETGWDAYLNPGETITLSDTFVLKRNGELEVALSPGDGMDGDDRRYAYVSMTDTVQVFLHGQNRYVVAALAPESIPSPFVIHQTGVLLKGNAVETPGVDIFVDSITPSMGNVISVAAAENRGIVVFVHDSASAHVLMQKTGIRLAPIGMADVGDYHFYDAWEIKKGIPLLKDDQGHLIGAVIGKIAVFGFYPDPEMTDFIYSPDFLPVLHRAVLTVSHRQQVYYVYTDTVLKIPVTDTMGIRVELPDGAVQPASVSFAGGSGYVPLGPFNAPGIYKLMDENGKILSVVVVNLNPDESDITPDRSAELKASFAQFTLINPGEEHSIPLKKLFLWLAFASILAEVTVILIMNLRKI